MILEKRFGRPPAPRWARPASGGCADTTTPPRRHRAGALLVLLCLGAGAAGAAPRTHERTLDNGLKVIVHEDHRAPVVTSQVWYGVGSSYEPVGKTGISHLLEHMMFKGTAEYGPGELAAIVAENGGRQNAFTGQDYTAYFQTLARDRLAVSFRLEADRMRNLLLDPEQFARERDVVVEERRLRVEDDPRARARERALAAAFTVNPYRQPVIGWRSDLAGLELADLEAWYQRWYQPANAVLVVAGDVVPEDVFALAREHFGPVTGAPPGEPPAPEEPPAPGRLRLDMVIESDVDYVFIDYKVPTLGSASGAERRELYALEVLAAVLEGNDAARLPQRLERELGLAASVSASYDLYARLPSLFSLNAVAAPGTDPQAVAEALQSELRRVEREPPDAEELERVRNALLAERVYRKDSLFYQALEIGVLETTGIGWRERERYEQAIAAVTGAEVAAAARRFLIDAPVLVSFAGPEEDE